MVHGPGRDGRNWGYRLGGEELGRVGSYKYLGIEMQRRRAWSSYKQRVLAKARRVSWMIKAVCSKNEFISVKVQASMWCTLVRPILEYGCEVWGGGEWKEAEALQRNMARFILGHKKTADNVAAIAELGWMRLKERRDLLSINYWGKVVRAPRRRFIKRVYRWLRSDYGGERPWSGFHFTEPGLEAGQVEK